MAETLHPNLTDREYWELRFKLFDLQRQTDVGASTYLQIELDLIEELYNYLRKEYNPWD
jgi:hypothetical protein